MTGLPLVATSISIGLAEVEFAREDGMAMGVVWTIAATIWLVVLADLALPWRVGRAVRRAPSPGRPAICPDEAASGSMGNRA